MSECKAALNIKGEHFPCDWPTDENGEHHGWAHSNKEAEAIWIGDDEHRQWAQKSLDEHAEAIISPAQGFNFDSTDLLAPIEPAPLGHLIPNSQKSGGTDDDAEES